MSDFTLLHYAENDGAGEYLVIVDDDATPEIVEEYRREGYDLYSASEIIPSDEMGYQLPIGRTLQKS